MTRLLSLLLLSGCVEKEDKTQSDTEEENIDTAAHEPTDIEELGDLASLRVHVFSATLEMMDAASVYTEEDIQDYIAQSNNIFEPTGIVWQIESFSIELAPEESLVEQSIADGTPRPGVALAANAELSLMLAPDGWDMYVIRQMAPLGFGGLYKCSLDGDTAPGAVFVPLQNGNGNSQPVRKWAHELGHMMNLPHTDCTEEYADNLMMSGTCEHANTGRTDLTADQIANIQEQFLIGRPAECD